MASTMIFYKKCICGSGTRTNPEPGCPVHDPPFETPSDKDFMAAHIESLKEECASLRARNAELEAEVERLKEDNEILQCEVGDLKAEVARLRKALEKIKGCNPIPTANISWAFCYDVAKQALEASNG